MNRIVSTLLPVAAVVAVALSLGPAAADPAGQPVQLAQWGGGIYVDPYGPYPPPPPVYGPRGYYVQPAPRRSGASCYTTRGTCWLGYAAPRGAPCRCFIPGFGEKRGNVI